ncbi:hypothetical protein [Nocardioides sp. HB32]
MKTRTRRAALALALPALLSVTAACGNKATDPESESNAKPETALDQAWDNFEDVLATGNPTKLEDVKIPQAPTGYTKFDVAGLAAPLIMMMNRSTDPRLSRMTPDQAVDYVYLTVPKETVQSLRDGITGFTASLNWQSAIASRFPRNAQVGQPVFINPSFTASRAVDDTSRPYLRLNLQTFIRTDVTVDGVTRPTVVFRSLRLNSYSPQNIQDGWPATAFEGSPYGLSYCHLYRQDGTVVPLTDVKYLEKDAKRLKNKLDAADTREGGETGETGETDAPAVKKRFAAEGCS